ncbi:MAG: SDR family NAD(P)-dependent oxidoreductase, partial [Cellulomonas sp.]|nr:SDR family NAD(P)-dependent oxidoreductase [Cellulomonas sp.]
MGTALVTGASAGLGLEFAWQLATARHDVVLVARHADRLDRVATQLRAAAAVRTEVIVADLADRDDVDRVAARLTCDENPVGLLVNNAGFSPGETFVDADLA